MSWFKRIRKNILTTQKKEVPNNIWARCKKCKTTVPSKEHKANFYVCQQCDYHERISAEHYFELLLDENSMEKLFANLQAKDILGFTDKKSYKKRLESTRKKTKLDEAIQVAVGKIKGKKVLIAAMDFEFIGGSMGSVVGEKIARSVDFCIAQKIPLLIVSKSGGARMMEGAYSLMQMAKTAAKLSQLAKAKVPYISLLTDPTTGGVSASFAMLGDLNIAEPKALIGFAGPRVIKETIKKELPEGFQSSEFLLAHGFLDLIVHRSELKDKLGELLGYLE